MLIVNSQIIQEMSPLKNYNSAKRLNNNFNNIVYYKYHKICSHDTKDCRLLQTQKKKDQIQ